MFLTKKDDYQQYSLVDDGLAILRVDGICGRIEEVRGQFSRFVLSRMSDDISFNRALIKNFVMLPEVREVFCDRDLLSNIASLSGIETPTFLGPTVSHFTSNDITGSGFGLPMHQDFPSMASSASGLVVWFALSDCNADSHSIRFLRGRHRTGLLTGAQTHNGYILSPEYQDDGDIRILNVRFGDVVVFSSFTPHATYVNPDFNGWKLSISQRMDDFSDKEWLESGLPNAYENSVDRNLYIKRIKQLFP